MLNGFTLEDVVNFCITYGSDNVFKEWSRDQIAVEIYTAMKEQRILVSVDLQQKLITGMVIYFMNFDEKKVYVKHLLCAHPDVLPKFMKEFQDRCGEDWEIVARRRGEVRQYKTPRLTQLVLNNLQYKNNGPILN